MRCRACKELLLLLLNPNVRLRSIAHLLSLRQSTQSLRTKEKQKPESWFLQPAHSNPQRKKAEGSVSSKSVNFEMIQYSQPSTEHNLPSVLELDQSDLDSWSGGHLAEFQCLPFSTSLALCTCSPPTLNILPHFDLLSFYSSFGMENDILLSDSLTLSTCLLRTRTGLATW